MAEIRPNTTKNHVATQATKNKRLLVVTILALLFAVFVFLVGYLLYSYISAYSLRNGKADTPIGDKKDGQQIPTNSASPATYSPTRQ